MLEKLRAFRKKWRIVCDSGVVIHPEATIVNMRRPECIKVGASTHIRGELLTFAHGGEIIIGAYCYIGDHSRVWSAGQIKIGDRVLISHGVMIMDSRTHPISARARHDHYRNIIEKGFPASVNGLDEQPIEIGDDVWVGCAAVILRGVTIGRGAIVGAGSVVTASVPPWTICGGNPAKVIRELTPEEQG
jgi:acetyltransferase-like isoleucine patch superfamily enzyme